jgi:hypothetical protein
VFGHGRDDDWDTGDGLYSVDRDDLGGSGFDYVPGHSSAARDSWNHDGNSRGIADETSALVRPYAVTGGRTKPRYQLQIEAMVAASHYEARDLSVLSPECQAILGFCRDWRSVAEISAVLRMPRSARPAERNRPAVRTSR